MENTTTALQARVNELELILNSINDGFFILDHNLDFTYVNRAFERICSLKKEDVIGTNYWQHFPEGKKFKFYTEFVNALHTQKDISFEEYSPALDKWVAVCLYPSPTRLSVYFMDITERRNAVRVIEEQNKRLKEIAWIQSHKVRGPLASILGLTTLLDHENTTRDEFKKLIDGILLACKQLDGVIMEIDEQTKLL